MGSDLGPSPSFTVQIVLKGSPTIANTGPTLCGVGKYHSSQDGKKREIFLGWEHLTVEKVLAGYNPGRQLPPVSSSEDITV